MHSYVEGPRDACNRYAGQQMLANYVNTNSCTGNQMLAYVVNVCLSFMLVLIGQHLVTGEAYVLQSSIEGSTGVASQKLRKGESG